jgi:hypothetical protein
MSDLDVDSTELSGQAESPGSGRSNRKMFWPLVLLFLSVVLLAFMTSHASLSVDPPARYLEAKALVNRHGFELDPIAGESIPPGVARLADGRYYSYFGIGQPLVFAGPYYICHKILGIESDKMIRSIISLTVFPLFLGFTALVFFGVLREFGFSVRSSYLYAMLLIFATGLWQVSKEGQEDAHLALYAALIVYGLIRYQNTGAAGGLALSAISVALFFITRSDTTPIVVCYFVFVAYLVWQKGHHRKIWPYLLIIGLTLPGLATHCIINYMKFGNAILGGASYCEYRPGAAFSFSYLPAGLKGFLFSPGRSLFLYNPILLLSLAGMILLWRKNRPWAIFIAVTFVLNLLLFSSFTSFHGNCCWGPRYFCRLMPILMIPAVFFCQHTAIRTMLRKTSIILVISVSLLVQIAAVSLHHNRELMEMTYAYGGDWFARQWTMFEPEANFIPIRVKNIYTGIEDMINGEIAPWSTKRPDQRTEEEQLNAPVLHYLAFWPYHANYYLPVVKPSIQIPLWATSLFLITGLILSLYIFQAGLRMIKQ